VIDLSATIEPKSDQTNADDLIAGPRTIRVTGVKICGEPDQPIAINFENDKGKPYKPCKSMRRLLVTLWGSDGATYAGRSMTLYCDPSVKFGGAAVGGIRISHLSHIDKPESVPLTVTRSVRKLFKVLPLALEPAPGLSDVLSAIAGAESIPDLFAAAKLAVKLTSEDDKIAARNAYADRKVAIEAEDDAEFNLSPPDATAEILAGIARHDPADLDVWLDESREQGLSDADMARVEAAIESRRGAV